MDILGKILMIIGTLAISIGFCIGAFMLHYIFGILVTGFVLLTLGSIAYEIWLES